MSAKEGRVRVGFCGYATSGKDVAASVLVEQRGFVKVNMSDALLRDLLILDPEFGGERLSSILSRIDFDTAKAQYPEFRAMLQRYGTDVWRSVDPDVWVRRAAIEAAKHERVVTTGVRFLNEMAGIDLLVHVKRPGVGPVNGHISDAGIGDVIARAQVTILNNGTVADLQERMLRTYDEWVARG